MEKKKLLTTRQKKARIRRILKDILVCPEIGKIEIKSLDEDTILACRVDIHDSSIAIGNDITMGNDGVGKIKWIQIWNDGRIQIDTEKHRMYLDLKPEKVKKEKKGDKNA